MKNTEETLNKQDYKQVINNMSDPLTRYALKKCLKSHHTLTNKVFEEKAKKIIRRLDPKLTFLYIILSVLTLGLFLLIRLLMNRSLSFPHKDNIYKFMNAVYAIRCKRTIPKSVSEEHMERFEKILNDMGKREKIIENIEALKKDLHTSIGATIDMLQFSLLDVEYITNSSRDAIEIRYTLNSESNKLQQYGVGQLLLLLFSCKSIKTLYPRSSLEPKVNADILLRETSLTKLSTSLSKNNNLFFEALLKPENEIYYNDLIRWLRSNPKQSGISNRLLSNDTIMRKYISIFSVVEKLAEYCNGTEKAGKLASGSDSSSIARPLYSYLDAYCNRLDYCLLTLRSEINSLFNKIDNLRLHDANEQRKKTFRRKRTPWDNNYHLESCDKMSLDKIHQQTRAGLHQLTTKKYSWSFDLSDAADKKKIPEGSTPKVTADGNSATNRSGAEKWREQKQKSQTQSSPGNKLKRFHSPKIKATPRGSSKQQRYPKTSDNKRVNNTL